MFDEMMIHLGGAAVMGRLLMAILLLVIAFVVAGFARNLSKKLFKKLGASKFTEKLGLTDEVTGSTVDFIGNLFYIIVFLLFIPAIFGQLGLQNAVSPITSMISQFLNYIPNIVAAGIILIIGSFIAKTIRQLLISVLKRFNVDRIQEKAGIEVGENATISLVLANVVYILILVPTIISALQALNIDAISSPAISMLDNIFDFVPNLFVAVIIIIIGMFIANMTEKLITSVLASIGIDTYIGKFINTENENVKKIVFSKVIGSAVKYIIALLFVVEALNVIDLEILRYVGQGVITYLPSVISAVIIMGLAYLLSMWVYNLIKSRMKDSAIMAITVKSLILIIAVIMTLSQLGIATAIVNAAFIIVLSAVAIAFAIAFGIGGREFAAKTMNKIDKDN